MSNDHLMFHVNSLTTLNGMLKLSNVAQQKGFKCTLLIENHVNYSGNTSKIFLPTEHMYLNKSTVNLKIN